MINIYLIYILSIHDPRGGYQPEVFLFVTYSSETDLMFRMFATVSKWYVEIRKLIP